MSFTVSRRTARLAPSAAALAFAVCGWAQTPPADSSRTVTAAHPAQAPKPQDQAEWSAVGATARCRDGSYFHGNIDTHSCADHGGIGKLLQARGQELIR